jgi:transcriptional regulator with XRE-family HTH domain
MTGTMHQEGILKARQIKAARALLDWSQDNLAAASKLSVATIRKLEVGNISPRGQTNQLIREAFENAGLEFIDPNGVRQRPEEITIYQGEMGARNFLNEVYETSRRTSSEIVQVWPSLKQLATLIGSNRQVHSERMISLQDRVDVKCIITEDRDFLPMSYVEYRFLSRHNIDSVQFYVYDDKCALIPFSTDDEYKIIVVQSRALSESFRRQFLSMWERATPLHGGKTAAKLDKKKKT